MADSTNDEMTDEQLVRAFEDCTLGGFHHRDHVRVTWSYLRRMSLPETLQKLIPALQRFAESKGRADIYHETITWLYAVVIHERMERMLAGHTFAQFEARNPDVLDWREPLLYRYYDRSIVQDELAKRVFVLPEPPRRGGD